MKTTNRVCLAILVFVALSAVAKEVNLADYPLTAHIVSYEKGGDWTDTLMNGGHAAIVHVRIEGKGYIISPLFDDFSVSSGTDYPARFHGKNIWIVIPDKHGTPKVRAFSVKGTFE